MTSSLREVERAPSSRTHELDVSPDAFGFLEGVDSSSASDVDLRASLERSGYLYLPGFYPREDVIEVRRDLLTRMATLGLLDSTRDLMDAVADPALDLGLSAAQGSTSLDEVGRDCQSMSELVFGPRSHALFERLLGGGVRHFDLTWFRAVAPGPGTVPHCDVVYMGRGSHRLYTLWVPYSDISLEMGGLMLLEGSTGERVQKKLARYLCRDVDEYCSNRPLPPHVDLSSSTDNKVWKGWLAKNPVSLRKNLGGRWLTSEYRMGDALLFSIKLVHGSLDNATDRFRLSSDVRYQRSDEPADDRFVGARPYGHVGTAKRGRIC